MSEREIRPLIGITMGDAAGVGPEVVVKALKEGKQVMLLRKGGIAEEEGEFRVEHPEFFLYPTFSHQARQYVRQPFAEDFEAAQEMPELWGRIRIDAYATIEEVLQPNDPERLYKLGDHHIWTRSYIDLRLNYRPGDPLYLLLCRTYLLSEAVIFEETREYRGCKSWVRLDTELLTVGASPALADAEFAAKAEGIRSILSQ